MYSILPFNGISTMVFKLCDVQTITVLDYQQIVTSGPGDRAGSYEELEDHMRLDKMGWVEESQRLTWLLSSPICAEVSSALHEYTLVHYDTGDQHKDMTTARQERDTNDI
jgi:hypothetical protein